MKKTKVFSFRLDVETLQSCFDLSTLLNSPTDRASTACSRALKIYTTLLRNSGKLPVYSSTELEQLTQTWQSPTKINPTSAFSLEQSSILDQSDLEEDLLLISQSSDREQKEQEGFIGMGLATSEESPSIFENSTQPETSALGTQQELEELIEKQIREIQLEDEINLLDLILIK